MTPQRESRLIQVFQQRQTDLTLITDRVHKVRNISALIRNCDAVGIPDLHYVEPQEGYRHYRGTAKGSDRWVQVHRHDSAEEAVSGVKARGMKVYAAHFSVSAIPYHQVDYTEPCAILMGAEKEGVSDSGAQLADQHIIIPMMGMVASFNVATAAGIILAEAQRQRQAAGLYGRKGLASDLVARYLFEARYPRLVQFCELCDAPYPDYNSRGELTDPKSAYPLVAEGRKRIAESRDRSRSNRGA